MFLVHVAARQLFFRLVPSQSTVAPTTISWNNDDIRKAKDVELTATEEHCCIRYVLQ